MGNIAHMYTRNQYLYWYIEKGDQARIKELLQKYPEIINQPMTKDCKSLPLCRAVWRGDKEVVELLLKLKASVNQVNAQGETALMIAAKRNRLEILKILISDEADVDSVNEQQGLQVIDYAILSGYYEIAHFLYPMIKNKKFKSLLEYRDLAIRYHIRYINYQVFLNNLEAKVSPDNVQDFHKRPKKLYKDPVIDPRQTWRQWFWRVMDFKAAPLVEREQLPEQLQPQNRNLGKLHYYLDKIVGGSSTKSSIYPKHTKSEVDLSESQIIRKKKAVYEVQSQV